MLRVLSLLLVAPGAMQHALGQATEPAASAASHAPAYDVVSVKPNKTGADNSFINTHDGNFRAENVLLRMIVLSAYNLKDAQLGGLPPWANTARFDIQAKVVEPDKKAFEGLTDNERRSMLRPILTERFQLKFHHEMKVLPVYELVLAKSGAKVVASELKQGDGKTVHGMSAGSTQIHNRDLTAVAVPMASLVNILSSYLQRIVVDKTGLAGNYDFELKWSPDDASTTDANAPPPLITAVQEQLGLRLHPAKAPIEIFVVDRAEMPVED